ncbi:MAG: SGNH/GDSL hydrolase family protein [Chloroflexota bacterium]
MLCTGLVTSCGGGDFEDEEMEDENPVSMTDGSRSLYVFGDSWADQMDDGQFQQELADRGYGDTVQLVPFGIGGTTMEGWSNDDDGILSRMLEAISEDPSSHPIVFFTLAGNDILDNGSAENVPADMRELLTQLEDSREDLQIVYAQYDIMNLENEDCAGLFDSIFGITEPLALSNLWLDLFAGAEQVAAEFDRVTSVNTYGSLQGNPGNPDLGTWSPEEYFADCIHLNDDGYDIYLDTVFDQALTPLIEQN